MICKNLKSGFNNFDQIKTKWKFMIRGGLSTVQKYRPELLISSHLTESAQDKRISNQRKGKLLKWKQTQQLHEFKSWNSDVVKTKKIGRVNEYSKERGIHVKTCQKTFETSALWNVGTFGGALTCWNCCLFSSNKLTSVPRPPAVSPSQQFLHRFALSRTGSTVWIFCTFTAFYCTGLHCGNLYFRGFSIYHRNMGGNSTEGSLKEGYDILQSYFFGLI